IGLVAPRQLGLPAVGAFWQLHADAAPVDRFRRFVLEEVAPADARTVILLDDLDALQALPLEVAEVLGGLRQAQEALVEVGAPLALTLGYFSSLPLERLVPGRGREVLGEVRTFLLPDFSREELTAFAPALAALGRDGEPVTGWLDAVFAWTGGHPQLTQHLCQQLVARAPAAPSAGALAPGSSESELGERVERLVGALFLESDDPLPTEPCLREMAQALTRSPQAAALLALYRRLLSGQPVTPDPLDELQRELRLCGLSTQADDAAGTPRLRPRCRLAATRLGEAWAREQEVRIILREAIEREADPRSAGAALLRGSSLKMAQAWARKNPAALEPREIRVLLASLEAARSEVEAKHQSSAAALQRELRDKPLTRLAAGSAHPATAAGPGHSGPARRLVVPLAAAVAVLLGLSLAALGSAHRRLVRLEYSAREAATRAEHAEQALRALQLDQAQRLAVKTPALTISSPPAARVPFPAVKDPAVAGPSSSARGQAAGLPLLTRANGAGGERRASALPGKTAEPRSGWKAPRSRHAAARARWTCPVPGRPAE
ncbi:MAG TPA: hypothetical protein PLW65_33865, partial [Pseudomonadota bacterium]|nr:hypothetical protein [Pseudomonadota bacterium]